MRLTWERLREVLSYDPETGVFTRKIDILCGMYRGRTIAKAGDVSGSRGTGGYLFVGVDGRQYYAHRLAWFYMTGEWPKEQVDHKNANRADNKWTNLREADHSLNSQNRRKPNLGKPLQFLGVYKHREAFQAKIEIEGKQKYIGSYKTAEEAYSAYVAAKRELHPGGTL